MIQRIQSVYLLLVAILLVVALCLPVGQFIGPDGIAGSYDGVRQSFADRLLHCFLRVYVHPEKRFECNGFPVGMGSMPACRMYHTELSGFPRYLS